MQLKTILVFFANYIEKELGIVYAEHNHFQLQNRLEEIAKLLGFNSIEKLYEEAQAGIRGTFKQLLLDIATNNETSFFRDPKIFRAVETNFLDQFSGTHLNIWSAASSSGQEALSLAMMIMEWNKKSAKSVSFQVTGTDISERILEKAKKAHYSQLEVQRGLPAPMMIRYFQKNAEDAWVASDELRRNMTFRKLNLKEHFGFTATFDLILCRNVLIYQSVESKTEILGRIYQALSPNGLLVLGAGESLIGLSDDFTSVQCDGAVFYRKKDNAVKAA